MIPVTLPDGRLIEVDTDDPTVAAAAAKKFMDSNPVPDAQPAASPFDAPEVPRPAPFGQQLVRQAQITTDDAVSAGLNLVGGLGDLSIGAGNLFANAAASPFQKPLFLESDPVAAVDAGQPLTPFGQMGDFSKRTDNVKADIDQFLSNTLGIAPVNREAFTPLQNTTSRASQFALEALVPASAAVRGARVGVPVLDDVLSNVARSYADAPARSVAAEIGAAGGASAGMTAAEEVGIENPIAAAALTLLSGVGGAGAAATPFAAADAVKNAGKNVGLTNDIAELMQDLTVRGAPENPNAIGDALSNIRRVQDASDSIGAPPSDVLLSSNNPGLIRMGVQQRLNPDAAPALISRDREVNAAQGRAMDTLIDPDADARAPQTLAAQRQAELTTANTRALGEAGDSIEKAKTRALEPTPGEADLDQRRALDPTGSTASTELDDILVPQFLAARKDKNIAFDEVSKGNPKVDPTEIQGKLISLSNRLNKIPPGYKGDIISPEVAKLRNLVDRAALPSSDKNFRPLGMSDLMYARSQIAAKIADATPGPNPVGNVPPEHKNILIELRKMIDDISPDALSVDEMMEGAVFHGTPKFKTVMKEGLDPNKTHNGIFFSNNKNVAAGFAAKAFGGEQSGIVQALLSFQKPVTLTLKGVHWTKIPKEEVIKAFKESLPDLDDAKLADAFPNANASTDQVAKFAKSNGLDGVIFKDIVDLANSANDKSMASTVHVALEKDTIEILRDVAQGRLAAARKKFEEYAKIYRVGEMRNFTNDLAGDKFRDNVVPSKTAQRFLKPGTGSREVFADLARVMKVSPNEEGMVKAAEDFLSVKAAAALDNNGKLNEGRLRAFMRAYAEPLEGLPNLKKRLLDILSESNTAKSASAADIAEARRQLLDVKARVKLTEAEFNRGAAGILLNAEPRKAVASILQARDPVPRMKEAVALVKGDKEAEAGLRKAVSEFLREKITSDQISRTEVGEADPIQITRLRSTMRKHRNTLSEVFSKEDMGLIDDVLVVAEVLPRAEGVRALQNSASTERAANLAPDYEGSKLLLRAKLGLLRAGSAIAVLNGVTKFALRMTGQDPEKRSRVISDIMSRAATDPDFARELLLYAKPDPGKGQTARNLATLDAFMAEYGEDEDKEIPDDVKG